MNTQTPLRFAILLEGVQLSQWQAECVGRLVASGAARLELIIKAVPRKEPRLQSKVSLLPRALWRVLLRSLWRKQLTRRSDPKLFRDVEVFACEAYNRAGALELGELDTEQIRSRQFDFILYFTEHTSIGGLATVAAHGVWSFRYGDAFHPSGPLAAFTAAVLRRDNVVRVALVRFSGTTEHRVLREGYFAVPGYSFKETLTGMLRGSADFPVLACHDLLAGREPRKALSDFTLAYGVPGIPGNTRILWFLICMGARKLVTLLRILLTREEWNTGFLDSKSLDPFRTLTAHNVRWLPTEGVKHFAADPFFLRRDDEITLLVEKLNPANNCGRIAASLIERERIVPLGTVIEEPFHSSYPCLVQSEGQIYCVPEQAEAKSIMLYRAIEFPLRWECLGPLLPAVEAVDSTLFQHGGYWWLAYTDASIDRNGRLMLWYANDLTGQWSPHKLNPVKIDPRCSRGAGPPFMFQGAVVRPSQDCSVVYGAKVIFNRIITLTPSQFHEEIIGELRPDPAGPYRRGLHTISYDGAVAVVDGKRSLFDLAALPPKGRNYLRRNHSSKHSKPDCQWPPS